MPADQLDHIFQDTAKFFGTSADYLRCRVNHVGVATTAGTLTGFAAGGGMAPVGALVGGAVGLWTGSKHCKKPEGWEGASNDRSASTQHALTAPSQDYLKQAMAKAKLGQSLSPGGVHAVGHVMKSASPQVASLGHAQRLMPHYRAHLAKPTTSKA